MGGGENDDEGEKASIKRMSFIISLREHLLLNVDSWGDLWQVNSPYSVVLGSYVILK